MDEQERIHERIRLANRDPYGYVIPVGPIRLVAAVTDTGMIGCRAFDIAALQNFGIPAAIIRGNEGVPIGTVEDLLNGAVAEANPEAVRRRIEVGMTGREALDRI
jgi:uncharacterized protein YunC (DUF1805 family)